MANICAIFFSVKTAPIQKPKISMQFEFWMKEIIILYLHYFNIWTLRTLISLCHKFSGLERFGFLVHESPCSSQKVQENVVHHVIWAPRDLMRYTCSLHRVTYHEPNEIGYAKINIEINAGIAVSSFFYFSDSIITTCDVITCF